MESHGTQSSKKRSIAVIPARLSSTRLESKLLLPLGGEPIIVRTARRAASASAVDSVLVATDDERIARVVLDAGFEAVLTSADHITGSDRIAEAIDGREVDIVVNVQGDEPFISPSTIDSAVNALIENGADFATTCERLATIEDILNPNVVKVVVGNDGFALYFSRSPIPFPRNEVIEAGGLEEALRANPDLVSMFRKHTGLYVFTPSGLKSFTESRRTPLEVAENLEQLRIIENGQRILVVETEHGSIGIDTLEDYERARNLVGDN